MPLGILHIRQLQFGTHGGDIQKVYDDVSACHVKGECRYPDISVKNLEFKGHLRRKENRKEFRRKEEEAALERREERDL